MSLARADTPTPALSNYFQSLSLTVDAEFIEDAWLNKVKVAASGEDGKVWTYSDNWGMTWTYDSNSGMYKGSRLSE